MNRNSLVLVAAFLMLYACTPMQNMRNTGARGIPVPPAELPAGASASGDSAISGTTAVIPTSIHTVVEAFAVATGQKRDAFTLLRSAEGRLLTQPVLWSSSNNSVASVSNNGQVSGNGEGDAVITASLIANPAVRVSIAVSVLRHATVALIKIEPATPSIVIADRLQLIAQVHMADGQINGNVDWNSSDDTIATINNTTGVVTALREGRVTILASYSVDPRYKGIVEVIVVNDQSALPATPSPMPIIFGPNATPLPTGHPSPSNESLPTPLPTMTAPAPSPSPLSESANSIGLGDLVLIDPRVDAATWRDGEFLVITAPPGNNLDPTYNFDAPRMLTSVDGDFDMTTRVRPESLKKYGGAGLVVSGLGDTYIRMEQARYDGQTQVINLGAIKDGVIVAGSQKQIIFPEAESELKITRRGDTFRLEYRGDKSAGWRFAKEMTLSLPRNIQVGILLVSDHPYVPMFSATFKDFALISPK